MSRDIESGAALRRAGSVMDFLADDGSPSLSVLPRRAFDVRERRQRRDVVAADETHAFRAELWNKAVTYLRQASSKALAPSA